MARNARVAVAAGEWVELTNSEDAGGAVKVQNVGLGPVRLLATATGTPPSDTESAGFVCEAGALSEGTLLELFPGVSSPARLWAWSITGTQMMVSYA